MVVHTAALAVTLAGGLLVLASYVYAFRGGTAGYLDAANPYWLGYSLHTIRALTVVQLVSAVGFFLFVVPWVLDRPPTTGLLGNCTPAALPVALGLFMAASMVWAPAMRRAHAAGDARARWAAILALWVAAAMAGLFVVGAATEEEPRAMVLVGTLLFALTIVGADGVAYTARMLTRGLPARAA